VPSTTLSITISNNDPNPNGNAAQMSKSGNGNPNQATWRALDQQYSVSLPASVWNPPQGAQLSFTVSQGQTSATYTLKANAPTGLQGYTIAASSTMPRDEPPKIMVEP